MEGHAQADRERTVYAHVVAVQPPDLALSALQAVGQPQHGDEAGGQPEEAEIDGGQADVQRKRG